MKAATGSARRIRGTDSSGVDEPSSLSGAWGTPARRVAAPTSARQRSTRCAAASWPAIGIKRGYKPRSARSRASASSTSAAPTAVAVAAVSAAPVSSP